MGSNPTLSASPLEPKRPRAEGAFSFRTADETPRNVEIRCEWGGRGLAHLKDESDALVIVDVFSFSTAVEIAAGNGAIVYPYHRNDESAAAYAASRGAILADVNREVTTRYSLAPSSLLAIPAGTRLVLPSPNGATLSLSTGTVPTFTGCLRNASAVARVVQQAGPRIGVIPAGERWEDGSLRPAVEDLIGAGAIVYGLQGARSPEAAAAEAAFLRFRGSLLACLTRCRSGKELVARNLAHDVTLAAALDTSECVPFLKDGAYTRWS